MCDQRWQDRTASIPWEATANDGIIIKTSHSTKVTGWYNRLTTRLARMRGWQISKFSAMAPRKSKCPTDARALYTMALAYLTFISDLKTLAPRHHFALLVDGMECLRCHVKRQLCWIWNSVAVPKTRSTRNFHVWKIYSTFKNWRHLNKERQRILKMMPAAMNFHKTTVVKRPSHLEIHSIFLNAGFTLRHLPVCFFRQCPTNDKHRICAIQNSAIISEEKFFSFGIEIPQMHQILFCHMIGSVSP